MTDETLISEREREILRLVATGATNQQIALQLNISVNTVKVHLRNIFGKIGVVSRTEATVYAVRAGLVSVDRADASRLLATEADETEAAVVVAPPEEPAPPDALPPARELEPALLEPAPAPPVSSATPEPAPVVAVPPASVAPPTPARPWPLLLGMGVLLVVVITLGVLLILRSGPAPAATPTADAGLPPDDNRWREIAPIPGPRSDFALASFRFDGKTFLYLISGADDNGISGDLLRYDTAGDVWVRFSPKPTPVADVQAAVVGSRIYLPGGRRSDGQISDLLEVYDPQLDTWVTLAPMPAPRSRYGLAAVEGKIYLFGGWDGAAYSADVWQYSPDDDSWTVLGPMPTARADAGVAEIDGQIFVVGGVNESGSLTLNQRYNPAEEGVGNPWTIHAPLPEPRDLAGVSAARDWIFVIAGEGGGSQSFFYNSAVDAWNPLPTPLDAPLRGLRALSVGNNVYILGGRDESGASSRAYEYRAIYTVVAPVS